MKLQHNNTFQVGLCLGSKLDGLALPGSSITEASLLALLPCLTSLRRLDLRGLDSLFMSGAFLSREEHRQQVSYYAIKTKLGDEMVFTEDDRVTQSNCWIQSASIFNKLQY